MIFKRDDLRRELELYRILSLKVYPIVPDRGYVRSEIVVALGFTRDRINHNPTGEISVIFGRTYSWKSGSDEIGNRNIILRQEFGSCEIRQAEKLFDNYVSVAEYLHRGNPAK